MRGAGDDAARNLRLGLFTVDRKVDGFLLVFGGCAEQELAATGEVAQFVLVHGIELVAKGTGKRFVLDFALADFGAVAFQVKAVPGTIAALELFGEADNKVVPRMHDGFRFNCVELKFQLCDTADVNLLGLFNAIGVGGNEGHLVHDDVRVGGGMCRRNGCYQ